MKRLFMYYGGPGPRSQWIPLMLGDWRGFCCLVLTDDSPLSDPVNKYVERYWWNLHAKSGSDLLILAVAETPSNWEDDLNKCLPKGRLRNVVRKNLRFLDRPDGVAKARSTVHAFLRDLGSYNRRTVKLPALAFFVWSDEEAGRAKTTEKDTDRIWERYPSLVDLSILEFPASMKPTEIDRIFDKVLTAARSAGDFDVLRKRIRHIGLLLRAKVTAGSLFCLAERLAPFVKPFVK